jgi:hypothetical protein
VLPAGEGWEHHLAPESDVSRIPWFRGWHLLFWALVLICTVALAVGLRVATRARPEVRAPRHTGSIRSGFQDRGEGFDQLRALAWIELG